MTERKYYAIKEGRENVTVVRGRSNAIDLANTSSNRSYREVTPTQASRIKRDLLRSEANQTYQSRLGFDMTVSATGDCERSESFWPSRRRSWYSQPL